MDRKASAEWQGGLKDGKGTMTTGSGILANTQYGFQSRFESGPGTNPEELIAAAHAGCFTMALSAQLGEAGITPESLKTEAVVTLSKVEGGFGITAIHLQTEARLPNGAGEAAFEKAVEAAKKGCPISKLFAGNTEVTVDAKLVG